MSTSVCGESNSQYSSCEVVLCVFVLKRINDQHLPSPLTNGARAAQALLPSINTPWLPSSPPSYSINPKTHFIRLKNYSNGRRRTQRSVVTKVVGEEDLQLRNFKSISTTNERATMIQRPPEALTQGELKPRGRRVGERGSCTL